MSAMVIDTNVLLVADGQAGHMSGGCRIECLNRLERVKAAEQVVFDRQRLILTEYGNRAESLKTSPKPWYGVPEMGTGQPVQPAM